VVLGPRLRRLDPRSGILVMPAAAFAVHQLRYWLAYGSRANAELAAQGHSYLSSLVPWTILALAVAAGLFLRRLAHAAGGRSGAPAARLTAPMLWLATWMGLVAIYAVQETLESFLATGHPGGMAGVIGHGGWWAVPVAAAVSALVTAVLLLGRVLLRLAATAPRRRWHDASAPVPVGVATVVVRPLARAAAGRAPPALLPSR
jgi:hypothetical protein